MKSENILRLASFCCGGLLICGLTLFYGYATEEIGNVYLIFGIVFITFSLVGINITLGRKKSKEIYICSECNKQLIGKTNVLNKDGHFIFIGGYCKKCKKINKAFLQIEHRKEVKE